METKKENKCNNFFAGLFNKVFGRKYQTFTKNVKGLGELTARGRKETDCKDWTKRINISHWGEAEIHVSSKLLKNESLLAEKVNEYKKAMQNIKSIVETIRNDDIYKEFLKGGQDTLVADETICIELNEEKRKDVNPHIALSYPSGKYYVWFPIQNGEMTCFTVDNLD